MQLSHSEAQHAVQQAEQLLENDGVVAVSYTEVDGRAHVRVRVTSDDVDVPEYIDGFIPTTVSVEDEFTQGFTQTGDERQAERIDRYRPVPQGVSYAGEGVTAGTSSFEFRDPESGQTYSTSCNHILARNNANDIGDAVVQPGFVDGGEIATDQVGALAGYVDIGDGATVDFAWAEMGAEHDFRLLGVNTETAYGDSVYPDVGEQIVKTGRTTETTCAEVTDIHASINIGTPNIGTITMKDLIVTEKMGEGGDSGSPCVRRDDYRPVGFLIAGNSSSNTLCAATNMEAESGLELVTPPAEDAPDAPATDACTGMPPTDHGIFTEVRDCTVSDTNIDAGETATLSVDVENTFSLSARDVRIQAVIENGAGVESGCHTIAGDETITIDLEIGGADSWADEPGEYDIGVVISDESPDGWCESSATETRVDWRDALGELVAERVGEYRAGGQTAITSCNTVTVGDGDDPPENEPPVAAFEFSPTDPVVDEVVLFDGRLSDDPDGTINRYEWRVDGSLVSESNTLETSFPTSGSHHVTLTVVDDDGAKAQDAVDIVVGEKDPDPDPEKELHGAMMANDGVLLAYSTRRAKWFVNGTETHVGDQIRRPFSETLTLAVEANGTRYEETFQPDETGLRTF
jgi:hypothetical protein